jgi:hypothetical protein
MAVERYLLLLIPCISLQQSSALQVLHVRTE